MYRTSTTSICSTASNNNFLQYLYPFNLYSIYPICLSYPVDSYSISTNI